MDALRQLENKFAKWFKFLPSLPNGAKRTLAQYLWVLTIIGAVFYSLMLVVVLGLFTVLVPMLSFMSVQSIDAGVSYSTVFLLLQFVLVLSLLIAAVGPLKRRNRSGWDKLFIASLATFIFSLIQLILNFNLYNLVSAFAWLAVEMYFLMQVKSFFTKER